MFIADVWFKVEKPLTLDWVFVTVMYQGPRDGLTVYHNAQNPTTGDSSSPAYGKFSISQPDHSYDTPSNQLITKTIYRNG